MHKKFHLTSHLKVTPVIAENFDSTDDPCNNILLFPVAVMNDIAGTMFNKKFLLEIFLKNQPIQSLSMLRAMFDKLAHASVMRLNTSSMDKVSQIEHYT